MKDDIIRDFGGICERLGDAADTALKAYVYLSWLGLSRDEIENADIADYNPAMKMLVCGERYVFVKEPEIAEFLSSADALPDKNACGTAEKEAEKLGLSHDHVYKMRYFYDKLGLKQSGQPEDIVREREIAFCLGVDICTLDDEFLRYEGICGK